MYFILFKDFVILDSAINLIACAVSYIGWNGIRSFWE